MKIENNRTLLIRPFIQYDESLSGFLYRVSKMNNYRFLHLNYFLTLSIYNAQNNEFHLEALQKLALVLRHNDPVDEKNGYNLQSFFGSELYFKIILKNKVKYCPMCIKEKYYHRTVWCFTPIHLCIKHNVLLLDECPECGHKINMGDFTNRRCEICSFSYENTVSCDVIDNLIFIESQRQLIKNLWVKDGYVFPHCNFEQYFRLAFYSFHLLIGAIDYTAMTTDSLLFFYNRPKGKKSGYKLANAFANVYWMYLDFPKHFYIALDHFLSRNKGMQRYERLRAFENIFNDQDFTWVQKAYNTYFIKQIDEGNVRKDFSVFKRNPDLLAERRNIRREEVRQSTGIAYEKLHELNDYNELQIEMKNIHGRQRYLVAKMTLDSYLKNRQSLKSKKEVGLIIGVTPDSVQKITDAGYLTPIRVANSPKTLFQIEEVKKLMQDCLGEYTEEISPSMVRFHNVLSKYAKYSFTILEIIAFTYSGHLNPYRLRDSQTLAENYYDEAQLKTCLDIMKQRRQQEKGFFFIDVMKILKIGERRLWRILREQHIEADFILVMKDGRKRYYFKEETVSQIRNCIEFSEGLS